MNKNKLVLIFLLFVTTISAQESTLDLNYLTIEDGLSQFSVNTLYIDEHGAIWIGTREGLNCYDGNEIRQFKLEKDNPNSLFSNNIIQITGDKKGQLFIHCSEGLTTYNLATEQFDILLKDKIDAIYYNKVLFVAKRSDIFIYDEKTKNMNLFYSLPNSRQPIKSLHKDTNGTLWIGTENKGIYTLPENKTLKHPIEKGTITEIYEDSKNELWIGSWDNGFYHVNQKGNITNVKRNQHSNNTISSNFVRSFCEDDLGNIWIGTFTGLDRFERKTNRFSHYITTSEKQNQILPSIWCIVKDIQGTLWMGTYFGGVSYFNPENEIYTRYRVSNVESYGLSHPVIGKMTEDDNDNLWIATEGGGLNVYNKKYKTFKWYKHDPKRNSISHNNVKSLYYDKTNHIMWIGTHLGGLNRLDTQTDKFYHYKHQATDSTSIPSDIIRDITPYKDYLILATTHGVSMFNPQNGKSKLLFQQSNTKRIMSATSILVTHDNQIWAAVEGEGIYTLNLTTQEEKHYKHESKKPTSLSNNNVYNLMQDKNGEIWISTSGGGLDRYDSKNDAFINYDMKRNGLLSDCIYQTLESTYNPNNLLIITNQGFSIFDKQNIIFYNFNTENGFPLSSLNENGLYATKRGRIFLGGINGMLSFKEKDLHFISKPFNLSLSSLFVNGEEVRPNDKTGILSQSLQYTSDITLNHKQNFFSIKFALSNYLRSNRDVIYYQLKGFSNAWIQTQEHSNITYTNLNPGTYTLIVKASNPEANEASINITILPPWYKTWWANLLYTLAVLAMAIYLFRVYHTRIHLQESLKYEQQHINDIEKLNQSKLRFFTNISHEFRTPLTLIIGQIESILQQQSFTPSVYNKIIRIYKSSIQLRELISELLDFRKQEQGHMNIKVSKHNFVNFINENYILFHEYASTKNIKIELINNTKISDVWYDQKQMQKVINNLFSNALKHTPQEGLIQIYIREDDTHVILEVKDSGKGIPEEDIKHIFDRFYQIDNQKDIFSTGIGLALTKGIMELHKGEINVSSKQGVGSSFTIKLKKGNDHFSAEQIVEEVAADGNQHLNIPNILLAQKKDSLDIDSISNAPSNAKILIVEDEQAIREMLADIFAPFYHVITACNGEEAWEILTKEMPNIVLTDVLMPKMSGTELCKKIKNDINYCHIPVVLLTARTASEHTMEGLRIGADDYITKPFNINILISRCNNLVNSRIKLQEKFSKQPQTIAQILATNPLDKEIIDKATDIIKKHLDDSNFNIEVFTKEMGMARTNLFTKIKAITGQTPNEFVLSIRLKEGTLLLRNNPELNISEISDRIGFSSARYFSKCFKDMYHVNPATYRKDILKQE